MIRNFTELQEGYPIGVEIYMKKLEPEIADLQKKEVDKRAKAKDKDRIKEEEEKASQKRNYL